MAKNGLIARVKRLSSVEFEHLVFDLLVLSGLRNAVWRTPGADGGRDIEGHVITVDMSENIVVEKWYVECKRYSSSVDWPTVYEKIAYAENHQADYILFVTTSSLSPKCKEEVSRREANRMRPRVRVWEGSALESLIERHATLLVKYGFATGSHAIGQSFTPLVEILSKTVQSSYGASCITGSEVDSGLELSAALVDLMSARVNDAAKPWQSLCRPFTSERDLYSWCTASPDAMLKNCDAHSLRAVLAAVRFASRASNLHIERIDSRSFSIQVSWRRSGEDMAGPQRLMKTLSAICLWSNLECAMNDQRCIEVRVRKGQDA